MSSKYGLKDGWRKLSKMSNSATRILSLPYNVYKELGYSRDEPLMAKWSVVDGKLMLEVKKMEVTGNNVS